MFNYLYNSNSSAGFMLIEVMLALVLFALLVSTVVGSLLYGTANLNHTISRNQASFLADEGLEAVRNIRDSSFVNLTDGDHGLTSINSQWGFSGSSDQTGNFSRRLTISTISPTLKRIIVTVTWTGAGQSSVTTSSTSYLADWGQL